MLYDREETVNICFKEVRIADLYKSQNGIHLTGFPPNLGREILAVSPLPQDQNEKLPRMLVQDGPVSDVPEDEPVPDVLASGPVPVVPEDEPVPDGLASGPVPDVPEYEPVPDVPAGSAIVGSTRVRGG